MTDPIADMLTRIRNAQMVKKSEVVLPYSKLKHNLLNLLSQEGWVGKVEKKDPVINKSGKVCKKAEEMANRFASLQVSIKYQKNGQPKISHLQRISKPGRRVYVSKDNIPYVLGGKGMVVISTPRGLLSGIAARKEKVGGEVICELY